jgi:hypothetical protein
MNNQQDIIRKEAILNEVTVIVPRKNTKISEYPVTQPILELSTTRIQV